MKFQHVSTCYESTGLTNMIFSFLNFHLSLLITFLKSGWKFSKLASVETISEVMPPIILVSTTIIYLFRSKDHTKTHTPWWILAIKVILYTSLIDVAFIIGVLQATYLPEVASLVEGHDPVCYQSTFAWRSSECIFRQQVAVMIVSVMPYCILLYDACTEQLLVYSVLRTVWKAVRVVLVVTTMGCARFGTRCYAALLALKNNTFCLDDLTEDIAGVSAKTEQQEAVDYDTANGEEIEGATNTSDTKTPARNRPSEGC